MFFYSSIVELLFSRMSMLRVLIFALVLLGCASNQEEIDRLATQMYSNTELKQPLPLKPFKSDGCSCWPDSDWLECCVEHDLIYWRGGSAQERKAADQALKKCIIESGHPFMGNVMYYGVRIGGVWWLPTSFRWGFGWDYPQSGPPD